MIGKLRQRLTLQKRSETPDAGGGAVLSWTNVADVWAEVIALEGSERVQDMRLADRQSYRVRLRYRTDISAKERFLFKEQIMNIRSVTDVMARGRWLECRCETGAGS